jgi:microcompartment protein CcmK/EutM
MKIGRVIGHVTATIKDPQLVGQKLLLVNIENGEGEVLEPAVVAADTCSAGPGDMVLVLMGSAARLPAAVAGLAIDATITAVLDDIKVSGTRSAGRSRS